jgi:MFS family permease
LNNLARKNRDRHGHGEGIPLLRALRQRNYRLFFIGQSISLVGTWMTRLTVSWLVWRLTHSVEMLGLVGFAGQIPTFLLAPFAGVWTDLVDRYRVLVAAQVFSMMQSLLLAALALAGVIQIWHILVLQVIQGAINAFDIPARQSSMVDMVEDPKYLPNAIALNSSMVNGARLVGPSIAGLLIAWVGEGWCFLIDGISYIAVIASLLAMRMVRRHRATQRKGVFRELHDGLRYAFGFAPIRAILMLLALMSLAGIPMYTVLLPAIVADVLHGGPHTLGFMTAAVGLGALAGALYLGSRATVLGLGRRIPVAAGLLGASLVLFSISHALLPSLGLMFLAGVGFMVHMAASNTIIQTIVREEMRGRVMAFYAMAFMGMAPFGSLLAGAVAARIGSPDTVLAGGVICMLGAFLFWRKLPELRKAIRPIYVEKGILPELATGLGNAANLEQEAEH